MQRARRASAAVVLSLVLAAAGGAAAASRTQLYFLTQSGKTLITAALPGATTPRAALTALAAGPTLSERDAGARPVFPSGTRLAGISVAGTAVTVAFRGGNLVGLRTIPRLRVIAAVTYTLTSLPTITNVRFKLDGKPWGVYDHAGRVIRDYRRGTLAHPWLTACAPGDGCFTP
jgi:spore germination protein GerM